MASKSSIVVLVIVRACTITHTHTHTNSFNKTEADFSTLREYNDYLEEIETIGRI